MCLFFVHNWDHNIVKSRLIFAAYAILNREKEMGTSGKLKKLVNDSELYNIIPNRKSYYINKFPYTDMPFYKKRGNCL